MEDLKQRTTDLEDLVSSLSLYTSRHAWTQLTTAQKELFADVIDSSHRAQDAAEGRSPGDPTAFTPVLRWWRQDADEARALRLTLPVIATADLEARSIAAAAYGHPVVILGCTATRTVTGSFAAALMRQLEEVRVHRVRLHNARDYVAQTLVAAAAGRRISVEHSALRVA